MVATFQVAHGCKQKNICFGYSILCITLCLCLWTARSGVCRFSLSTDPRTNHCVSWVCFGHPGNLSLAPVFISPLALGPQYVQFVQQNLLSRNDQKHIHTKEYLTNSGFKCEILQVILNLNGPKSKHQLGSEIPPVVLQFSGNVILTLLGPLSLGLLSAFSSMVSESSVSVWRM